MRTFVNGKQVVSDNIEIQRRHGNKYVTSWSMYHRGYGSANYPMPAIIYKPKMDLSYKFSYYIFDYSKWSIGYLVRVLETI